MSGDDETPDRDDPEGSEGDGVPGPTDPVPEEGWRRWLYRVATTSVVERLLISVAALVLAILVGAVLVVVSGWVAGCGDAPTFAVGAFGVYVWNGPIDLFGRSMCYDPWDVYVTLFLGAIGGNPLAPGWNPRVLTGFAMGVTLKETTLLVFTGLSVAVAFRAGLFNIGTQGQLVFGALASAVSVVWLTPYVPNSLVGSLVVIPVALLVGSVAGGLYGAIPGALKAYADANEVITTIMLNFVAAKLAFVLTSELFQDPNSQQVQTVPIRRFGLLPAVVFPEGGDFSVVALGLAVLLALAVFYLLWNTAFGYDLRTGGIQPEAAEYGGVDAKRTTVAAMTLSGALGGLGGAVWVLMVTGRFVSDVPALGFDGITVSILAGNHPLGAGLAAVLFGVLKSGSLQVEFSTGVPKQLVGVLRGLVILFVAMPEFFRMIGRRTVVPDRQPGRAAATDGGRPEDAGDGAGGDADPTSEGADPTTEESDPTSEEPDPTSEGAGTPDGPDDDVGGEDRE